MLWWILLIVVALVVIGWGVRRSRAGKAIHPDQSEINAARKREQGVGSASATTVPTAEPDKAISQICR
jgi:hypothetical protein